MPRLSDTVARLAARRRFVPATDVSTGSVQLARLSPVGSNPGNLGAYIYVPQSVKSGAALVVVLHGCTQSAAGYDGGAGWSQMADRYGFALLFPEQRRANNPNLCFNWFNPEDNRRGSGEPRSIRDMIAAAIAAHAIDPTRIFITGLSAGGAMVSVMLATYPEVFAGGAIIAGLPYGCASTVPEAFNCMQGRGLPSDATLTRLIDEASDHDGPWPTLSIWHGSADATVDPANAEAIVRQWRSLHRVTVEPNRTEAVDGYPRRVWRDADQRDVIEEYRIAGMGHGTPLDTQGSDGCGLAGAFMLEAGISSTRHICHFWDLIPPNEAGRSMVKSHADPVDRGRSAVGGGRLEAGPASSGVGQVIEDALRAAGLLR